MGSATTTEPIEREIVISVPTNKAENVTSFDPADFTRPTGREEEWRFTPIKRAKALFEPLAEPGGADVHVTSPQESFIGADGAADASPVGSALIPVDLPSALAWAGAEETTYVSIPGRTEVTDPITVTITGTSTSYQKVRVTVGRDSSATVVIDHIGSGFHGENVEVELGSGSRLTLISIQDWDRDAVHLGRIHTRVGRDAQLTQVVATFGGDVVRLVSTVDYDGTGGSAELLGASFADAGQHLEHRLFVDHATAHCRSNVIYKSALQGEHAHTVWIGDVLIRAAAVGTDTYEINRNLVLTEGARADSVPNLEIETGEVSGAGHASATGRFDDEQLFYLQSRGIPTQEARRLVVRGFFADVIDRIPTGAVRDRLWQAVADEIAGVGSGVGS
ncbi:MAG: Fe-S cluster assembly protein SufD [Candidatus Nanopelagicales bacterium]